MVIFGAGASYDSAPFQPPGRASDLPERPPLADQLFDDRPVFADGVGKFPQFKPILPHLRNRPAGKSVERVLKDLQAEAYNNPQRYRHLAAIRYYLHFVIWQCELLWNQNIARDVTNYKTFLDRLESWRKPQEQICLVTFNYDRMLESVLPSVGVQINQLADYIGDKYPIIKLHGSVNWAREVDTRIENLDSLNDWRVAEKLIDMAPDLDVSTRYCLVPEYPVGKTARSALFPAIAIPVEGKVEAEYECPAGHIEVLHRRIPEVTILMLIGWSATDLSFLELLAMNLRKEVRGIVVAGDEGKAGQVVERLQQAGINGTFDTAKGGFTDFVRLGEADEFLRS